MAHMKAVWCNCQSRLSWLPGCSMEGEAEGGVSIDPHTTAWESTLYSPLAFPDHPLIWKNSHLTQAFSWGTLDALAHGGFKNRLWILQKKKSVAKNSSQHLRKEKKKRETAAKFNWSSDFPASDVPGQSQLWGRRSGRGGARSFKNPHQHFTPRRGLNHATAS